MSDARGKTVDEILEEFREFMESGDTVIGGRKVTWCGFVERMAAEEFVARIKEAHESELQDALDAGGFVGESAAHGSGNAAKLRDALKEVLDKAVFATDHATMLTEGKPLLEHCRLALYAPPRNCDMYETAKEAREAFQKYRGHRVYAECSLWDPASEVDEFVAWLFANEGKCGHGDFGEKDK